MSRAPREENASYSDSILDRFVAIAVVQKAGKQEQRTIPIDIKLIGSTPGSGVPPLSSELGDETVAFIPTAEHKEDLVCEVTDQKGKGYLDISLGKSFDPAARLLSALQACVPADIAVGSEMSLTPPHFRQLSQSLSRLTVEVPAMVIAGSAPTEATSPRNLAWNEVAVFNAHGTALWSQRKLVPYSMDRKAVEGLGFLKKGTTDEIDPALPGVIVENNASGEVLSVIDVESIGRCVIQICQDFKAQPLVDDVLREYQPDWVFVPILAPGCTPWVRKRAFELFEYSQARFAVCSSTSFCHATGGDVATAEFGLAVGPMVPSDPKVSRRAAALLTNQASTPPMWAKISWATKADWEKFKLEIGPAPVSKDKGK